MSSHTLGGHVCAIPILTSGLAIIALLVPGAEIVQGQTPQGSVVAWGRNNYGQSNVPAPNTGFVAIAAGYEHSLGLKAGGSIVAWWGNNRYGQSTEPSPNTDFVAVAAGGFHSLGLKAGGSIVAWGCGAPFSYGQCNVPAPNADFVGIAAGSVHSLGLKADGSIVAWGCGAPYNYGQCSIPAPNTGFVTVAAGVNHSLGLKADGSIVAWGYNEYGQTNVPVPNTGFIAVTGGGTHSLGLQADAACCLNNKSCRQLGENECNAQGGLSHGPSSNCQSDQDSDSIADACDNCPLVPNPDQANLDGDALGDPCDGDVDGDGVDNGNDSCPGTLAGIIVGTDGCPVPFGPCCFGGGNCIDGTYGDDCIQVRGSYLGDGLTCGGDVDRDGVFGCNDRCPLDREKTAPGFCGCGVPEGDRDGDGVCDAVDRCPLDNPDDSDGDGVCDSDDPCPFDNPDDTDGDGVCDSNDGCPLDPEKTEPGICGCGVSEVDSDGDSVPDCLDQCAETPAGVMVNDCGCPARGACCFDVGVCFERVYGVDCFTIEGEYQGDGSVCANGCGFGDYNGDGAVDLRDFALLQLCFTGVSGEFSDQSCVAADIDGCGSIDLSDYAAFQQAATGP